MTAPLPMFDLMTSEDSSSVTSSPASADGATRSDSPDGPTIGLAGRSRALVASSRAQRDAERLRLICGPNSGASSLQVALASSLANRLPQLEIGSMAFCADVAAVGYDIGAAVLPAVAVGHDHARHRLYFVGDTDRIGESGVSVDAEVGRLSRHRGDPRELGATDGVSRDVVALSGFGDAIVPDLAAAFIEAYCDARGLNG